jgi:stress response protein YsnF
VVREEVRIHKESRQEQRPVSASVRREEAEIEEDHDDERDRSLPPDPDASHP